MKHEIKQSLIIAGITIFGDYLMHYYFTSPQETFFYFTIKFVIAYYISYFLLKRFENRKYLGIKTPILASVIFALIFSLYYRLYEYFYKLPFAARVPDIFGIAYYTNPLLSILIWGLVHSSIFYLGYLLSKKAMRL